MNLNFRIVFFSIICIYIVIGILFFNLYKSIAVKNAEQQAEYALDNTIELRAYYKQYLRPTIFEALKKSGEIDYFNSALLSSNYMTNIIFENISRNNKTMYEYRLASNNPLNPVNKTTKFEDEILSQFIHDKNKKRFVDIIEENGKSYFIVAKPIERNTKACLDCHGSVENAPKGLIEQYGSESGFNYKVGDLNAMIYIKIALSEIFKGHMDEFFWGGFAMFFAFLIISVLIYYIFQKDANLRRKKEMLYHHQNRLAVMGSMIGNISHQLKQPLTHLSNVFINLELQIERKKLTNEKMQEKINDANEQIKFMTNTIDDFKNFFSPKDRTKNSNIDEIISRTKSLLNVVLSNSEIELDINIKDNFIVFAPQNEIMQVFVNIINNAKDALISNNKANKIIKIEAFSEKSGNIVTIENNGGNIKEVNIDKIFNAYFSTKNQNIGTGIGLYMSKSILLKHKSSISVKNTKDGVIFRLNFNKNNMYS